MAETVGVSKSSVSRQEIEASEEALRRWCERRLEELKLLILYVDGLGFGDHPVLVAVGVDEPGQKHVLGRAEGAIENEAVAKGLLEDWVGRGLKTGRQYLWVIDGSKALRVAIDAVFGAEHPRAIGDTSGPVSQFLASTSSGIPNWQELFGSLGYCSCMDCRSVYSAAAYFVDLLQFLGNSGKNSQGFTPLDILIGSADGKIPGRRPDLPYLKLNCENTNATLPYVDLVNEILEGIVVINTGKLNSSIADKTPRDATASDLSVTPEYTNANAYNAYLNAAS